MTKFQIKFRNNAVEKDWFSLKEDIPDKLEQCKIFLQETPQDRLKSGGKLKKLKGRLKGILQYDITDSTRVRYRVNSSEHIIYIEYIGYHT
jgi:mRNA-degrading endonuclease RelE of RelBE toxin-antitoxin system